MGQRMTSHGGHLLCCLLHLVFLVANAKYQYWGWYQLEGNTSSLLEDVFAINSSSVLAVGDDDTILLSQDAGVSWLVTSSGHPPPCSDCPRYRWKAASFFNEEEGWVVGTYGMILCTKNGGITWETQLQYDALVFATLDHRIDLHDIDTVSRRMAFVVGDDGFILRTLDGGATWVKLTSRVEGTLYSVSFPTRTTGWVAGDLGNMLLTTEDSGVTWDFKYPSVMTWQVTARVLFLSLELGWVVGSEGHVAHTRDMGRSWEALESCTTGDLTGINVDLETNHGWIVSSNGAICWSTDAGLSFGYDLYPAGHSLNSVHAAPGDPPYAVGPLGMIKNGGSTSSSPTSTPTSPVMLRGMSLLSSGVGYVVGDDDIIRKTHDFGETWQERRTGVAGDWIECHETGCARYNWYGVSFYNNTLGWAVGTYSAIVHTTDGGVTWVLQEVPEQAPRLGLGLVLPHEITLWSVASDGPNRVWVVGDHARMLATVDGGTTWYHQDQLKHRDMDFRAVFFQPSVSASSVERLWMAGGRRAERTSLEGSLWHSSDGGAYWERVPYLPNVTLASVWFLNSSHGWAAGEAGTILRTSDGGQLWQMLPKCTAVPLNSIWLDGDSGIGLAVGEEGVVVQSRDMGLTWQVQMELHPQSQSAQQSDGLVFKAVQEWPNLPGEERACWTAGYLSCGDLGFIKKYICSPPQPPLPPPSPPTPPSPPGTVVLHNMDFTALEDVAHALESEFAFEFVNSISGYAGLLPCGVELRSIFAGSTRVNFAALFPPRQDAQSTKLRATLQFDPHSVFNSQFFAPFLPITTYDLTSITALYVPPSPPCPAPPPPLPPGPTSATSVDSPRSPRALPPPHRREGAGAHSMMGRLQGVSESVGLLADVGIGCERGRRFGGGGFKESVSSPPLEDLEIAIITGAGALVILSGVLVCLWHRRAQQAKELEAQKLEEQRLAWIKANSIPTPTSSISSTLSLMEPDLVYSYLKSIKRSRSLKVAATMLSEMTVEGGVAALRTFPAHEAIELLQEMHEINLTVAETLGKSLGPEHVHSFDLFETTDLFDAADPDTTQALEALEPSAGVGLPAKSCNGDITFQNLTNGLSENVKEVKWAGSRTHQDMLALYN
ncbi:hypothetical protein CYMTET_6929 [Cymbomonas tetramitiformis]|uniref:Photosynthesis system II assembly factor Ycf48/Hcf136-like domain-containing protein n=1 Tax=Cymbomonas tetramitiformis TaxID=36881 RepID=A0AAE0LHD7_9CHLO|nr:hypothetical protein CYMTET_6929 [Cymbomonas tetramitiformis]